MIKRARVLDMGGGFYDRTIAAMSTQPLLVGLAYHEQELDFVPVDAHDMALDAIVTDKGLRWFRERSSKR